MIEIILTIALIALAATFALLQLRRNPHKKQAKAAAKWIDTLYTTDAKQRTTALGDEKAGYCCLGLGCHVLNIPYDPEDHYSKPFALKVGLHTDTGGFIDITPDGICSLAQYNDLHIYSFHEIARVIIENDFVHFIDPVAKELRKIYAARN